MTDYARAAAALVPDLIGTQTGLHDAWRAAGHPGDVPGEVRGHLREYVFQCAQCGTWAAIDQAIDCDGCGISIVGKSEPITIDEFVEGDIWFGPCCDPSEGC